MGIARRAEGVLVGLLSSIACSGISLGQCPNAGWTPEFTALGSGVSGASPYEMQVFDPDGGGPAPPALYIGGEFQSVAGLPRTRALARWDGRRWADVGGGISRPNNGYVRVTGLGLHDPDGEGPLPAVLVVAGYFTTAGAVAARNVATWNGANWAAIGDGILTFNSGLHESVLDFDEDGSGPLPPSLLIGGSTDDSGGYRPITKWDGSQWSPFPSPSGGPWIFAMAVFDEDGDGPQNPALFAGIKYNSGLQKWDGTAWSIVGGGLRSIGHLCSALKVLDEDGPGPMRPALFVGGGFSEAGTVQHSGIVRWDGQAFTTVAGGIQDTIEDIAVVDYTHGAGAPTIFAVGGFTGDVYSWRSGQAAWSTIGTSNAGYGIAYLVRLGSMNDGVTGSLAPALYLTGPSLTEANGLPAYGMARYACTCYSNCDLSGVAPILNANDFQCFMNRFAAGDSYANCDHSTSPPVINANDFQCYINSFAAGCN